MFANATWKKVFKTFFPENVTGFREVMYNCSNFKMKQPTE